MTIDKPGFYKTRDGRKARVLCVDAPGKFPCVGYVPTGGVTVPFSWEVNGFTGLKGHCAEIVAPWTEPKPRRVAWIDELGYVRIIIDPRGKRLDAEWTRAPWLDEPEES
jgi:hypothetical protein